MSRRARNFSVARELKHADSGCYGEPVDVDALVRDRGGDARQTQEAPQQADEASQCNASLSRDQRHDHA